MQSFRSASAPTERKTGLPLAGADPLALSTGRLMRREEKMRVLGEMASGIIHDLNNLLGAILGRAQIVQIKSDVEEIKRQVAQIEKIAVQGGATVKRLQDFIREGERDSLQPTDLNQVITDAVEVTRHRWETQAQQHGIVYTIDVERGSEVTVSGTHSDLVDAAANLILNAIDAMPQGGPLTLAARRDGPRCLLSVTDEGTGMTPEEIGKVFSPFYTTKGSQGSGLGLAVVHGVVTRHHGHIRVESTVGKGSRFVIELPATDQTVTEPAIKTAATGAHGRRVLLVDDDTTILDVIGEALRAAGHDVDAIDNGARALGAMRDGRYDVVVTDLGMPGVTGWEVARAARDMTPRLPVIIISGWGAQIDKKQLSDCGVDALLAKPFRLEQIRETVARVALPSTATPA
ncbi:MAG: ATP-binding protein [Candidatus Zixiibacteriota bacterium]